MTGKRCSSLGDGLVLVKVILRKNCVFALGDVIINMLSNIKGFISEFTEVSGLDLRFGECESICEFGSKLLLVSKSAGSEWSLGASMELVNNCVPDSMKFVGSIVILQRPIISSFITIVMLMRVSIRAVKRLMNITHVVNNQTKGD